ncbi:hypothetical protein lerEdw1_011177 [Lerista edwardsae]|nr:hypothetical protein lerEdw1_011177 [Lerista edwardsae]
MKSSFRAGLHRELLNSTSAAFHPVKRISGLHLKPYLKLQKKERSLDLSPDPPPSPPMSQPRGFTQEESRHCPAKPSLFPSPSLRKSLGSLSPNGLCRRTGSHPPGDGDGDGAKERRSPLPATIHQGDDGEGPLDIWAVVKPGNTKEKIAFFAAQQCSPHRAPSALKSKSTWDIDGRATKRRKKSLDLRKATIHLERMREASGRCLQPEPFACGIEHCSVHNVNEGGEGGAPGRPLSVIEMVAFLEQRASVLLAGCSKACPSASAGTRCPGQPKAPPPAPGPFPTLGPDEAPSEKAPGGEGEQPAAEPLRVLDMVAKLESACLRRQSEREAGGLSRNNSFRRNVGRVLLASGGPAEGEGGFSSSGAFGQEEGGGGAKPLPAAEGASARQPPAFAGDGKGALKCDQGAPGGWSEAEQPPRALSAAYPGAAQASPQSVGRKTTAADGPSKEPVALPPLSAALRLRESLSISISVAKAGRGCRQGQPASAGLGEESLPGRLFLLLSEPPGPLRPGEAAAEEGRAGARGQEAATPEEPCVASLGSEEPPDFPPESALPVLGSCRLKRQRSHDFLETRFKIQQLLEPQQYLAFLPHHILVKIFGLLPTRSLVALKCTCGYFKFVIEYYNIRPADSRWVRDPRYREDPCKQCKKKYVRGDVSLCRWHPKPYCQALPYGPGYWMCCHRSQKGVPGCKLGLHDNHWVPACHSFNRAIHKKSREADEDC